MNGVLTYPFVRANSANYATGRQGYRPVWFVVHATATDYADNYPANLGKYWAKNAVQVSVHFCVSDTMAYQYVDCDDTAFQTRNPGNLRGIGIELVGQATWSRNEWLAHKMMLRRAAKVCAEVSEAYGLKTVPELLSKAALSKRLSGLTCHRDLTMAFSGTHTDPGPNFPWDFFFTELNIALRPVRVAQQVQQVQKTVPATDVLEDDVPSQEEWNQLTASVGRLNKQADRLDDVIAGAGAAYPQSNLAKQLGYVVSKISELERKVDALAAPGGAAPTTTAPNPAAPSASS